VTAGYSIKGTEELDRIGCLVRCVSAESIGPGTMDLLNMRISVRKFKYIIHQGSQCDSFCLIQPAYLSVSLSVIVSLCLPVCVGLSVCHSLCLLVFMSPYLSVCLSACLRLSISLSLCMPLCHTVYHTPCMPACQFVSSFLFVSLHIRLSVSLCVLPVSQPALCLQSARCTTVSL
jgi:hypothetical protein